ncbi:PREDICTED: putative nuclease HARBI1 [Cyphomyrmex costatus]|uniref:putative nuclease HARBI1 n=1 Tax=Cyphomyrmex costatus TaxID=456900 RepID=UPI00085231BA|nr:PREDICTED: putative nuclease HARBI1 [Cyphomyrmex costatus]
MHRWIARRKEKGLHHNLFLELSLEDPNRFRRCLRMNTETFEELLEKVSPLIEKKNTHLRESIPAAERLSLTLRHLATGESQESLSLTFRIGQSTISGIIKEVCRAIVTVLKEEYLKAPSSEMEWQEIARNFGELWQFENCIGAIDGKHCRIDPPLRSGSLYYCYKDFFSIVLMAVVDAHLRFIYVDIGINGRISDSGVWNKCILKTCLESNSLHIPGPSPLFGTREMFPYVLIGDEGFPLTKKLLIPYPGSQCSGRKHRRIFNYRLSRARRCSENAFGILGARFQIYRSAMRYDPDDAKVIIMATCCLHNMLRSKVVGRAMYTPPSFIDEEDIMSGEIRPGNFREESTNGLINLNNQEGNRHANSAILLRNKWCNYFNAEGAVSWQERMVR